MRPAKSSRPMAEMNMVAPEACMNHSMTSPMTNTASPTHRIGPSFKRFFLVLMASIDRQKKKAAEKRKATNMVPILNMKKMEARVNPIRRA